MHEAFLKNSPNQVEVPSFEQLILVLQRTSSS